MKKIEELQSYLKEKNFSQLFLLVDSNTSQHCMPILLEKIDEITDRQATLLEIPANEGHKTLKTAEDIINSLMESKADRNSCLISLGGGMIMDLGGFVASIYKRGIQNINVPTTLLSMVDAAIGGKTAVNHSDIKNIIGTFNFQSEVFVDTEFLNTLTNEQIKDGVAEMLKTFLVADEKLCETLLSTPISTETLSTLITPCAEIKERIVSQDPYDLGIRKKLNFGHTLGHAVEVFYNLSHGHSVAIGMYYALGKSVQYCNFPIEKAEKIKQFILANYEIPPYEKDMPQLVSLMRQDKKNEQGKINFILLEDIGQSCLCSIDGDLI